MKNKILSIAIIFILIPQIVFATWWNPLTWFEKEKLVEIEIVDNTSEVEEKSTIQVESEIIEKTVIKEVKVPIEKVVEKTITIQDQTIIAENIELKNKIKELEAKYNQCLTNLKTAQSNTSAKQTLIAKMEAEIKDIENKIDTLNKYGYICIMSESGSSSCQNNIKEQERWPIISQLEAQKLEVQEELNKLQ